MRRGQGLIPARLDNSVIESTVSSCYQHTVKLIPTRFRNGAELLVRYEGSLSNGGLFVPTRKPLANGTRIAGLGKVHRVVNGNPTRHLVSPGQRPLRAKSIDSRNGLVTIRSLPAWWSATPWADA